MADQQLRMLGLCTWLPLHLYRDRIRAVFPRYLFVQVDLTAEPWRAIYRTRGVATILGTRFERPATVPNGVLEVLWSACAANGVLYPDAPRQTHAVQIGARLRFIAGPLADLTGICRWSSAKRLRLLMEIMGRSVTVTVDRAAVEVV